MKRTRRARIVATLGAATSSEAAIRGLLDAGVDAFRLDFGRDTRAEHAQRLASIRRLEAESGRPVGVLIDVQDREDLAFGLDLGVDWVALSSVRAEDIADARALVGERAWIIARLDRPAAIGELDAIVALADGILIASGDLGSALPADQVADLQHRVVSRCRRAGKPVAVALQALERIIDPPSTARDEARDVAAAICDGVDALVLPAESPSDRSAADAVATLDRIVAGVEALPSYRSGIDASHTPAEANTADAVCCSLRRVAALISPAVLITYTDSGSTSRRAARERPVAPILSLTPELRTARRLSLVWGVHPVLVDRIHDVGEMVKWANRTAVIEGFAGAGSDVVIVAGLPFGEAGTTNLLHVSRIAGTPVRAAVR